MADFYEQYDRRELEGFANALVGQADRLIPMLGEVEADFRPALDHSKVFREVSDAYDRLESIRRSAYVFRWQHARVDGKTGDDMMGQLDGVRNELRKRDMDESAGD